MRHRWRPWRPGPPWSAAGGSASRRAPGGTRGITPIRRHPRPPVEVTRRAVRRPARAPPAPAVQAGCGLVRRSARRPPRRRHYRRNACARMNSILIAPRSVGRHRKSSGSGNRTRDKDQSGSSPRHRRQKPESATLGKELSTGDRQRARSEKFGTGSDTMPVPTAASRRATGIRDTP